MEREVDLYPHYCITTLDYSDGKTDVGSRMLSIAG